MAITTYKWRGSASSYVDITVSNIASDNSGVKSLAIADKKGTLNISYSAGGEDTAYSTKSYTSRFSLASTKILQNGYEDCSFKTTVTWKSNNGTYTPDTTLTAYLCEPATSMTVSTNNANVWSTYTAPIPVTRTFVAAAGATPWAATTGAVVFSSLDTAFVTVLDSSEVINTSAKLATLTSKTIDRSTVISISGVSSTGAPDSNKFNAAPIELSGSAGITIKNATESLNLTLDDNHLYIGKKTTATVRSTPHANGTGSVVFSNALTSISTTKAGVVSTPSSLPANSLSKNINTFDITGMGAGVVSLNIAANPQTVGNNVSASVSVTCSSLNATQTVYTYSGGQGSYPVYHDAIRGTSSWASLSNNSLAYNGFTGGQTGTVSMSSGATVSVVCSVLQGTQDINLVSSSSNGTTRTIDISNDKVLSYPTDYISYSLSGAALSITAKAGKTGSSVITMRSGAVINVNIVAGKVGDNDVQLNVGDSRYVEFNANDGIKTTEGLNTVFTYTVNSNNIKINAIAKGTGLITMNSGLTIKVTVTNITVSIS